MKPYRQLDSMKRHERQRLDWLSVRKKGIDEGKNHLLRGWLVRMSIFVCPGTNAGQGDCKVRREGNQRKLQMDTASPTAMGGRKVREEREEAESRKGVGQKHKGAGG